jgi:hypothetical protein
MGQEEDDAMTAGKIAAGLGEGIAAVAGLTATAGAAAVTAVAGAGAAIGVAGGIVLEHETGGVISDGISHVLTGLVGEDESKAAADAFSDGNYIQGGEHMLDGALDTAGHFFGGVVDDVENAASGAVHWAQETAGEAYDQVVDNPEMLME